MKADCMIKNGKVLTPTGTVICGVAVLDASAAALKLTGMLVDLRKTEDLGVSRHLNLSKGERSGDGEGSKTLLGMRDRTQRKGSLAGVSRREVSQ